MFEKLFIFAVGVDANRIGIPQVKADDATFGRIIGLIITAIGAVALFYIIRGALLFVTSNGDPNDVKQARTTILIAVVSLVMAMMVFGIVNFFISNIGGNG